MIKVIIADDHIPTLRAILAYLKNYPDIVVVGEATNGRQVINLIEKHAPDVIILDILMPEMDGITATQKIRQVGYQMPILLLSGEDRQAEVKAINARPYGYIFKEDAGEFLVEAIHRAYEGKDDLNSPGVKNIIKDR
jgi:DNA-binding NarL/FixJ family response regulator